jgi:hypothetical protein
MKLGEGEAHYSNRLASTTFSWAIVPATTSRAMNRT